MRRMTGALVGVLALIVMTGLMGVPAEARSDYSPLNRPGPRLTVAKSDLKASLSCHGKLKGASLKPVLLSPATGVTPLTNYSWNYEKSFAAEGRPWCTVEMPYSTLGDIQTAGEYLVYSIRTMYKKSGRKIAVVGQSQGGMSMRWALRFWPDTRSKVNEVIGLAPSNHGTTALMQCITDATQCVPAVWQQKAGSKFIRALNSRAETFQGISYSQIYTFHDEVVTPNSTPDTSSSSLHTGKGRIANIATQQVCPLDVHEHLGIGTLDPVGYALVMDALDHQGPAKLSRIDPGVCTQLLHPGVDPADVATYLSVLGAVPGLAGALTPFVNVVGAPEVSQEPQLRCYTSRRGC